MRSYSPARAAQIHDEADVADGLIGIAQGLERLAKRLKHDAALVRQGRYLADFAFSSGRNVRYSVIELVDVELPDKDEK